jgi:hypothetical protein
MEMLTKKLQSPTRTDSIIQSLYIRNVDEFRATLLMN